MKPEKKIITWKKADQKLCRLAALMLEDAMRMRLNITQWEKEYQGSDPLFDTFVEIPLIAEDTKGNIYEPGIWSERKDKTIWAREEVSPQCFYSISNIIRLRLKHARLMLYRNLFGTGNKFSSSTQRSRNPQGRKS